MENGAGYDFVHCEEVGQQAVLRAVELFEKAQPEVLVELIRGLRVHDVYCVYPLPTGFPIEADPAVIQVLLKMQVRLKREAEASGCGFSLERIRSVVVDVAGPDEASIDTQPSEDLGRARQVDDGSGPEPAADPGFVPLAGIHVQETLPCEMESNAEI